MMDANRLRQMMPGPVAGTPMWSECPECGRTVLTEGMAPYGDEMLCWACHPANDDHEPEIDDTEEEL